MIFSVEIETTKGHDSKMLDGRISCFETAKTKAEDIAQDFVEKTGSKAGHVVLVGDGEVLGYWVWSKKGFRWESEYDVSDQP